MDTTIYNREQAESTLLLPPLETANHSDTGEHLGYTAPATVDGMAVGCEPHSETSTDSVHSTASEYMKSSADGSMFPANDSRKVDAQIDETDTIRLGPDGDIVNSIHAKSGTLNIFAAEDDENDIESSDRIGEEIPEQPLVVDTDTNHDVLSFEPDEDSVQNEALVKRIYGEIGIELNKGRQSDYDLGKLFHRLQRERAKPGSGTFLKDVEIICYEWTISRSTIYRRINFFVAVNKGMADLEDARLSHDDKDAWPAEWESDDVDAEEKDAADALAIAQKKVIEEAARRVAAKKAENSRRDPVTTIKLSGLSPRDRKEVYSAFSKLKSLLGNTEASEWVAHEILSHARYLSTPSETAVDAEVEGD